VIGHYVRQFGRSDRSPQMEQRLEKQTEEMTRAAKEITEAVKELRTAVERLAEIQRPGGFPEDEAVRLAQEGVREVREELRRERLGLKEERRPAPTPEEIREWERLREERRRREGYKPI
jgi:hypothetical protein